MAGIAYARAAVAYSMLFGLFASPALALDPKQSVDRYMLATFTADDGLPSDIVNALLQTRDGFLWVGTSNGIARFDGRHFTTVQLFHKTRVIGLTRTMAQGPDGSLWAGTNSGALRIPAESLVLSSRITMNMLGIPHASARVSATGVRRSAKRV